MRGARERKCTCYSAYPPPPPISYGCLIGQDDIQADEEEEEEEYGEANGETGIRYSCDLFNPWHTLTIHRPSSGGEGEWHCVALNNSWVVKLNRHEDKTNKQTNAQLRSC